MMGLQKTKESLHAFTIALRAVDEMTSISCFLCKFELKKDEDKEIFLIAKFLLN